MGDRVVTVFGGTGFLGRRIVRALVKAGSQVRVAARKPKTGGSQQWDQAVPVAVDIRDDRAVADAVKGAVAVVNAVSLYVEKGDLTFEGIHVQGAARIARHARAAGVQKFVHVSGIGVNGNSPSAFVRARARGEEVVWDEFENATVIRPSVMFDCDEAFVEALETVTRLPVVPLFGRGDVRLQPAYVNDVADAIAAVLLRDDAGSLYELGGSKVYTYRQAVQAVAAQLGRKRLLMPLPFPVWRAMVAALGVLPNPPLTRDQLILMESDNIVHSGTKTFADLGIQASSLEDILQHCYRRQ